MMTAMEEFRVCGDGEGGWGSADFSKASSAFLSAAISRATLTALVSTQYRHRTMI